MSNIKTHNKNTELLNKTYKVEMVMMVARPGFERPTDYREGSFTLRKPTNDSTNIIDDETIFDEETSDELEGGARDYFNKIWKIRLGEINEISIKDANETANKIKELYKDKLNVLSLNDTNSTLETTFIVPLRSSHFLYAGEVVKKLFEQINKKYELKKFFRPKEYFEFEFFENMEYNQIGTWPHVSILGGTYANQYFAFEFPYKCPKFIAWEKYASHKDNYLKEYFNSIFDEFLSILIEKFKETPIYYDMRNKVYIKLTEFELRNNLTVSKLLLDNLMADAYNYGWDDPELIDLIPEKGGITLIENMYKFILYEVVNYSDLNTNLIVAPFFKFAFKEFNQKIKFLSGVDKTLSNFAIKRKFIWISAYESNIAAFYKMMNYDWRIKDNSGFISQSKTWPRESFYNETIPNDLPQMPLGGFKENFSFELISVNDINNSLKFYVGFRENFNDNFTFVLDVPTFNHFINFFLMEPSFTPDETYSYCDYK